MNRRIIVTLNLNGKLYKFFSIFFSGRDASFYIYQHIKNESSPIKVGEPIRLLKTKGDFHLENLSEKLITSGNQVKLSIHPNRIYLKKHEKNGRASHLVEEFETQPFVNKFRFHAFLIPPPISHLETYKPSQQKAKNIIFEWNNKDAPLVEIHELQKDFNLTEINKISPNAIERKIISSDGLHSTLVLAICKSVLIPPLWIPYFYFFGKAINDKQMTIAEFQKVMKYNDLSLDISSIPDGAIINKVRVLEPNKWGRLILDSPPTVKKVTFISPEPIKPPSVSGLDTKDIWVVNYNIKQKILLSSYLEGFVKDKKIIEFVKASNKVNFTNNYTKDIPCDPGVGYIIPSGQFIPLLKVVISFESDRRKFKSPKDRLKKGQKRTIIGIL